MTARSARSDEPKPARKRSARRWAENTSPHLAEKLTGGRSFVTGTLAQLIRGECKVDHTRPAIFSPFGLGVLDLAVGHWIYERAVATGKALQVPDFFFELKR